MSEQKLGRVYMVGVGCGRDDMIKMRGKRLFVQCDAVVYDDLIDPSLLDLAPIGAEWRYLGKRCGKHSAPQGDISAALIALAQAGKTVVRLKGGDPFVFGRGGEELLALNRAGVPCEEVPGITSAVAIPAGAGIPVTHRGLSRSFHVITGHTAHTPDGLPENFAALARCGGTLVFLMGLGHLEVIARRLMEEGRAPDTPVAVVSGGNSAHPADVRGTLADIARLARDVQAPAVIVVGGVCALADQFDWFDHLPLKGKRVVVTRPRERAGTLSARLRALGADVWEYPCIATVPITPCPAVDGALERLSGYEWLALTSPAGVDAVWACLDGKGLDARALGGLKLAAIGPGTAKALSAHGLRADYVPEVYDAAHLGAGLPARGRVLILRAGEGSPALTEALKGRNIGYDDVACYRTVYENPRSDELRAAVESGAAGIVTFTSASTVKGFVASVGEDADFSRMVGACIGAQTAAEARKHGIPAAVAREATMDALVELITALRD